LKRDPVAILTSHVSVMCDVSVMCGVRVMCDVSFMYDAIKSVGLFGC
jgi:hypothetical protein